MEDTCSLRTTDQAKQLVRLVPYKGKIFFSAQRNNCRYNNKCGYYPCRHCLVLKVLFYTKLREQGKKWHW